MSEYGSPEAERNEWLPMLFAVLLIFPLALMLFLWAVNDRQRACEQQGGQIVQRVCVDPEGRLIR